MSQRASRDAERRTTTDFAVGLASGDFKANTRAFYLDDTYKITPKLTLTLGMRREAVQPWKDDLQNEVNVQFQIPLPSVVNVDPRRSGHAIERPSRS